jgi:hypothetical protein
MKLQNLSYTQGFILAFTVGFVVRLIPELLSFPYPIGWDTIYYAYRISDGALFGHWNDVFSTWLIYGVLVSLGNLTQLDPFLLLKIVAPLLYGGTSAGIFFVAWKKLDWSVTKSLLASGFFVFQVAALAISWQFYRNVFGVMVLLFAIPFVRSDIGWKGMAALSVLGLLIAWGHELATVSLFFIVFGLLTLSVLRKEKIAYRLFVAIIPALIIFFGNFMWISPYAAPLERNMIWLQDSTWAHPGGLFFLTDYLRVSTPIESYGSYFELFYHVGSLFVLLYAIMLPLLLWGRWMLMLVFPFTFFAANGLWKAAKSLEGFSVSRFLGWFKVTKKVGYGLALVSVIVGGLFMTWPLVDGKYGIIGWEGTFKYVPSTMQSSSVPLRDTEGVIEAYKWLNSNMDVDSSLLVHDVFEFWTLLYLNHNYSAYVFDSDLKAASNLAVNEGFSSAYFVWWNQDIGWYNLRLQDNWVSVFDSGRISVYQMV